MKFYTVAASLAICLLSACSSNPNNGPATPAITQPKIDVPTTTLPDVVKEAASKNTANDPMENQGTTPTEAAPPKKTTTKTTTRTRTRVKTSTKTKVVTTETKSAATKPKPAPPAKPKSHQSIGDLLNAH